MPCGTVDWFGKHSAEGVLAVLRVDDARVIKDEVHAHLVDGGGAEDGVVGEARCIVHAVSVEAVSWLDDLVHHGGLLVVKGPVLNATKLIDLSSVAPLGSPDLASSLMHVRQASKYVHIFSILLESEI
jgi:hypothetical protein